MTTDLCYVIFLSFKLSINYLTANVKLSERKEGQKEKKAGLDIANLYLQGGRQQRELVQGTLLGG